MSEGKPGWRRVKFGEVVRLCRETCKDPAAEGIERYIGLEHIEPGDLRVRSWGDVADGTTFTNRVRPGQVLFGKRRAYQRKVAVADFDAVCSGDIYVFESANPGRLLPELLPFFCQTDAFFDHAVGTSAGSLSPRTNWSSLAEYEFALPPLEEQRAILTVLQACRTNAECTADAASTASQLEQAILFHAFPPSQLDNRATAPLSEVAEVRLGYKVSPVHKGQRVTKQIITVAQLQDGRIDAKSAKEVTIPLHMVEGYRPPVGSLLMTEGGNLDQLGRGAIWQGEIEDCIYQNHVFSVTPRKGIVRVEYLEGLMRGPRGREFFLRHAKRTSNLATIDQRKVRTMAVPVVPLADQIHWIEQYSAARSARIILTRRSSDASALARRLTSQLLRSD